MRIAWSLFALSTLAGPAMAQDMITPTPEQIGQVFCIGRTGNDEAIVRALLTPELTAAVDVALAENEVLQQAAPDEKPPLGDGIPWASYQDYASECAPGAVAETDGITEIEIVYGFPDYPSEGFSDRLVLKRVGAYLRIDNMIYATEGNLRDVLASVFNY